MFRRKIFETQTIDTSGDFKKEFNRIKRIRHFFSAWETRYYSAELENLINSLDRMNETPETKVKLLFGFFKSDSVIINKCDDSNGEMTCLFGMAADIFAKYAGLCSNKKVIAKKLFAIYSKDEYSMCDFLIEKAGTFLSKKALSDLMNVFWSAAENAVDRKSHFYLAIRELAEQMKEPELYEKACRAQHKGEILGGCCDDTAKIYLEAGKPQKALELLEKNPTPSHWRRERDNLLFQVYAALENKEELIKTAWRIFLFERNINAFNILISVLGKERREELLAAEAAKILSSKNFSFADTRFLIDADKIDDAENYLLKHALNLDGIYYSSLLSYAAAMENNKRWLASAMIHRALLESILLRANTKYYSYGVKYLLHLKILSDLIIDWESFKPHSQYFKEIKTDHKRKVSFWGKYSRRGG